MSMKILIAEDSPTEALKAKLILEKEGYQVSQAADGQEALQIAVAEQPDLIVMDTIMPRMTGYEAYQHLKANPQTGNIPVLMLMSPNGNGAEPEPKSLGLDTYIAKPYAPGLLLDGVRTATTRLVANTSQNGYSDNFLAIMSHELRTPLHELVGMTDLLQHTNLSSEQQKYINKAKVSINALSAMVGDLLEFSELEAGDLDLQTQAFDVWGLVENTAVMLQSRAEEKGLRLNWHIADDAPRSVIGDSKRLRQILSNLLGNAVKFTEDGEVRIEVMVDEVQEETPALSGAEVAVFHFSVHDTGVGIPPDKQYLIFEAFQQSDTSNTRHYGGIGLGLAVANQLVTLMGGKLDVDSSGVSGEGSVFHFALTLPLDKDAEPVLRTATSATLSTGVPTTKNHALRVLLAEDSPTNQLIATANLNKAGHAVTVAENGRIAVETLTEREFDLVLMDVAMPEMDGLEATRVIRKMEQDGGNGRHIPIIAMTAFAMKGYREKCLDAGMDGYVSKPISAEELHRALQPFLEKINQSPKAETAPSEPPVNLQKALEIVDEDMDILEMVVEMYPREYPDLVASIGSALATDDAAKLEAAAHRLKAVLGSIGSGPAFDLAGQLEAMGIAGEMGGGTAVYDQLELEIQRIADFYASPEWMTEAAAILGENHG